MLFFTLTFFGVMFTFIIFIAIIGYLIYTYRDEIMESEFVTDLIGDVKQLPGVSTAVQFDKGGPLSAMGITPPYKDGKWLSALDANSPADDVCLSGKKHSIGTDVYCGKCPPENKSKCKKQIGEECSKHEDCHEYGIAVPMDRRTGCCRRKCVYMKNENGLLCKRGKLNEACRNSSECEGEGGTRKIVCCESTKRFIPSPGNWGTCMKPGINTGIGYCPNAPGISKEKPIGGSCKLDTDCSGWGWGVGGKGTRCCGGKCIGNPHKTNTCPYPRGTWLAAGDVPIAWKLCASGKTYKEGWDVKCA